MSQQTLLGIQLEGYTPVHLTTFKERVEYVLNGMFETAWPSEETLFQFVCGRLKPCRSMSRVIERIKESPTGSNTRSFKWIWAKLTERRNELKEDQNEPYGFTSNVAPLQVFVALETQFASFAAHAGMKQQRL